MDFEYSVDQNSMNIRILKIRVERIYLNRLLKCIKIIDINS